MAKPSAYPGFKKLLKEWNKKLEESGFEDIETEIYGDPTQKGALKGEAQANRFNRMSVAQRHAKQEFFKIIEEKIRRTPIQPQLSFEFFESRKCGPSFESEREYFILKLYSKGIKQVEIKKILGIEGHRCQVFYPIYKWLRIWGLKK